ncbi:MAG: O-antigen ligase family protein [candidate division Zixibacteria bacterium]|nr:O-antigen ligase family protein [candidate division Zixibacteria bacterium]
MTALNSEWWLKALLGFYALFIFSSAFSIALSQSALGLALFLFLINIIRDRHQPFIKEFKWFYIFIGLYIFWLLLTSAIAERPLASMKGTLEEWLFFIIPVGIYLFQKDKYRRWLLGAFAAGVFLTGTYGIIQHFTGQHWFKSYALSTLADGTTRVSGNFSHPLTFGNYFAVASLFFIGYAVSPGQDIKKWIRRLIMVIGIIGFVAVMFTFSRGAMAASVVGLLALGLVCKRKYFLPVMILVAVLVMVIVSLPKYYERYTDKILQDFDSRREESRVFIWGKSLHIIADHPLFGVGQGGFSRAYKEYLREDIPWWRIYPHAHNDFLQVGAISGIPGLMVFGGIWVGALTLLGSAYRSRAILESDRRLLLAALLGSVVFLTSSLSECTFGDEEVRQLLMFIWAVGLSVVYKNRYQNNVPVKITT